MSGIKKLGKEIMPPAPRLREMFGPSFILIGMGLGSGELILWPFLAANYGLGIMWAAVLGVTVQFFINMEIERYTLVTGESVFVGLARKLGRLAPVWFIFSSFVPWIWPGILLSSATIFSRLTGSGDVTGWAVAMLLTIGLIQTLGRVIYKTMETIQKVSILVGVPLIFGLAVWLANEASWQALTEGLVGLGNDYWLLPAGIPLMTFLGALAYSGAGGNLNLAQSYYIKEKGYGMGRHSGRITGFLAAKSEHLRLEGKTFDINLESLGRFRDWWKKINTEHWLVFWVTGVATILLLSLLSYSTVYLHADGGAGIGFLFAEAGVIGSRTGPIIGMMFLIIAGVMLFLTQLAIVDATSRIMSENLVIFDEDKYKIHNLTKYYYGFVWGQIFIDILVILAGFKEPLQLVIMGAVLNAISMFVYSIAVVWLNTTTLKPQLRPSQWRLGALVAVIGFLGFFGAMTLANNLF